MAGKTFAGNLRIAPVDSNGVILTGKGYIGVLNTVKCELVVPAPTNIDQISRQIGSVGQLKSRAQVPKATTLNLDIDDLDDQRVLAYALNGQTVAYTQSGGTITNEVCTAGALGDWFPLANRGVSSLVLKDSTGTTTFAAGTDYLLDAASGFVQVVATGTITAGESLKANYTAAAITGQTVQGSTVASNLLRVVVELENLVDGKAGRFVCPIFQASSSGNQDLFGNKMLVAGLSGAMFLPPTGTAAATETGGAAYLLESFG